MHYCLPPPAIPCLAPSPSGNTLAGLDSRLVTWPRLLSSVNLSPPLPHHHQNMIVMTVHLQLLPGIKIPKHRAMIISTLILVLRMCQKEYMCIREKWKASEKDKCIILCNAHHHQATATNNSNDKNKIAILKWRKPKISNCETQWSTKIKYTYVHIIV